MFMTMFIDWYRKHQRILRNLYKKIRATIDKNIKFARLNYFEVLNFKQLETYKVEYGILELKFPQNVYNEIDNIQFDGVEITSSRHSKYTVGLNLINK